MKSHFLKYCLLSAFVAMTTQNLAARVTVTSDTVVTETVRTEEILPFGPHTPELDLKTNLLRDAVGTINIAGEMKVSPRASAQIGFDWNPWTFSNYTMYKSWTAGGELRWWPRQKGEWTDDKGRGNTALQGHFLGLHLLGGEFNYNRVTLPFNAAPSLKDHRYEGWMFGGGVTYGYRYNVSRRIALEASIGAGVLHVGYDKYNCDKCGERVGRGSKIYVGPTQARFSLVVRLGRNPRMNPEVLRKITQRVEITRNVEKDTLLTDTIYIIETETVTPQVTDSKGSIRHADFALHLTYPLNSNVMEPLLGDNAVQLDSLNSFLDSYTSNPAIRIQSIDIIGYASVEGNARSNLLLSERRAESAAQLVRKTHPDLGPLIAEKGMGEDWESLDFEGKQGLMHYPDLDERERKLRLVDGGRLFERLLKTQLPDTRRIECIINYTLVEF